MDNSLSYSSIFRISFSFVPCIVIRYSLCFTLNIEYLSFSRISIKYIKNRDVRVCVCVCDIVLYNFRQL